MGRRPSHRFAGFAGGGIVCLCALLAACAGAVKETLPAQELVSREVVSAPSTTTQEPASAPVPVITPPVPEAPARPAVPAGKAYSETGVAIWYGKELQGEKTASGEVFDQDGLIASHRTLPLGTVIHVTNLDNSRSIDVRIVDRGPFIKNITLGLSTRAARELGFLANGFARVKIEAREPAGAPARYTVQAATYTEEENARLLKDRLSSKFEHVFIVQSATSVTRLYHVRIGSYASEEKAEQIAEKLTREGLEPVVLRKD